MPVRRAAFCVKVELSDDPAQPCPDPSAPTPETRLRAAAGQLEASFLAEMLRAAGLGKPPADFGGGAGEEQFTSFLVEAQAESLVAAGGIGLAETLFAAMMERQPDA